ncbi:hypothetical protein Tco_1074284 [Tanacetum coccineum]
MRATKQSREPGSKVDNIMVCIRRGVTSGIRATLEPFEMVGANLIEHDESLRGSDCDTLAIPTLDVAWSDAEFII